MSSRRAKVARVILIATPDNSSSKEGDDEEEETGNEIQVEFEAIGPEEEEDSWRTSKGSEGCCSSSLLEIPILFQQIFFVH